MYTTLQFLENGAKKRTIASSRAASGQETVSRRLFIYEKSLNIYFLVDTGAEISVLPKRSFRSTQDNVGYNLEAANGSSISTFGQKKSHLRFKIKAKF